MRTFYSGDKDLDSVLKQSNNLQQVPVNLNLYLFSNGGAVRHNLFAVMVTENEYLVGMKQKKTAKEDQDFLNFTPTTGPLL